MKIQLLQRSTVIKDVFNGMRWSPLIRPGPLCKHIQRCRVGEVKTRANLLLSMSCVNIQYTLCGAFSLTFLQPVFEAVNTESNTPEAEILFREFRPGLDWLLGKKIY